MRFGHILGIFWTLWGQFCPKCVYTYIVLQHPIFYPYLVRTFLVDLAAFKKLYAFISANFWPIRSEVEKEELEELIKTTTFIELLLAARRGGGIGRRLKAQNVFIVKERGGSSERRN